MWDQQKASKPGPLKALTLVQQAFNKQELCVQREQAGSPSQTVFGDAYRNMMPLTWRPALRTMPAMSRFHQHLLGMRIGTQHLPLPHLLHQSMIAHTPSHPEAGLWHESTHEHWNTVRARMRIATNIFAQPQHSHRKRHHTTHINQCTSTALAQP